MDQAYPTAVHSSVPVFRISYFSHYCDKNNLSKGFFDLRSEETVEVVKVCWRVLSPWSESRKMMQLPAACLLSLLFSMRPQSIGWCHSHSGGVLKRNLPENRCPEEYSYSILHAVTLTMKMSHLSQPAGHLIALALLSYICLLSGC